VIGIEKGDMSEERTVGGGSVRSNRIVVYSVAGSKLCRAWRVSMFCKVGGRTDNAMFDSAGRTKIQ
jgi:hypothetical protein